MITGSARTPSTRPIRRNGAPGATGEIIFENDRLDYVFHRLGQLYNVEFTVCDPSVNCYVYHAVFTDETLPEILEMLKISAPIRYEILQADSPAPNIPKQHIRVYGK